MRITATVKDVTETFFERLATMPDADKLEHLLAKSQPYSGLEKCISVKIGNGDFRDRVDYNALRRQPVRVTCEGPLPRRGYRLFAFEVAAA